MMYITAQYKRFLQLFTGDDFVDACEQQQKYLEQETLPMTSTQCSNCSAPASMVFDEIMLCDECARLYEESVLDDSDDF